MAVTSEKLFTPPLDLRFLVVLGICGLCTLPSAVAALVLALRHVRAGQAITGTLAPHARSVNFIIFVLGVPVFSMLSLLSVMLVELAPLWRLLQTVVLVSNFGRAPALFISFVGSRVRLQLLMREQIKTGAATPLRLYGQAPCCFARICLRPKVPEPADLPRLRLAIFQLCLVAPTLALLDVVIAQETALQAAFPRALAGYRPVILAVKLASQFGCMSACKGLQQLVAAFNARAEKDAHVASMQFYCQSFLLGLNIVPTLLDGFFVYVWGPRHLESGAKLTPVELANFGHSVCVCVATLLVTRCAWKAFPVDSGHYPELFCSESGADCDPSQKMLKLRTVKFCPFCGSQDLQEEANTLEEPAFSCLACGSRGIPVQLETW